jgi:glycine/D-amino acid oxidase-like deaminating enzyme
LKVALLESEVIGFGASGRNAGFSMTLFGFTFSLTARVFGKEKAVEAHHYMEKAVDLVQQIVQEEKIDCEYEHPWIFKGCYLKEIRKKDKT